MDVAVEPRVTVGFDRNVVVGIDVATVGEATVFVVDALEDHLASGLLFELDECRIHDRHGRSDLSILRLSQHDRTDSEDEPHEQQDDAEHDHQLEQGEGASGTSHHVMAG